MTSFGNLINEVAGSSAGIETILKRKTNGGFTSNVCKAMNQLGIEMYLAAAWGYPQIEEVFLPLAEKSSIHVKTFTNPGITMGLEFDDGKIMLNNIESVLGINWELIKKRIGIKYLFESFERCKLIGLGYWAVNLHFEDIFMKILSDVLPSIGNLKEKMLFLDLADVKRRTTDDLVYFLKILPMVEASMPLLLSLNDQEAKGVISALKKANLIKSKIEQMEDLTETGMIINEVLDISYLVIHSPHFATITTKDKHYWVTEGYTSNPSHTIGAGDHFNAGTVLGLACNLNPAESILMGNALTAVFVRTGISPNFKDLKLFITNYLKYIEEDNPSFP
ncbi:MAG: hypothetical protein EU539_13440 [Promethearchaeota archaeon]|nr:MAG: hypothetical protein EU539_13440 [Candidatus Lokiarchaeota archaeon]